MAETLQAATSLRFWMVIDSVAVAFWREVSGLDSENEVIEYRVVADGGKNVITYKVPGALKWGNVTCKRGVTDDTVLHKWRADVEADGAEKHYKAVTITLFNANQAEVASYTLDRAWPCKFKGPALDSTKGEIAIEEFELAHHGLKRKDVHP